MKRILIVGATSAIAEAAARTWAAQQRHRFYLLGRDSARLEEIAADLRVRGAAAVGTGLLDATDLAAHASVLSEAVDALGGIDIALIAHGMLPDQAQCERDAAQAVAALSVNAVSVIALATELANRMENRGQGALAVIGSVAGDRGRRSNYVYGTAKAAVDVFLQGLRHRLHGSGVRVFTIKPGLVATPMTAGMPQGPLWASASTVGAGIVAAVEGRPGVVYLPRFWRLVMLVIRFMPTTIFHRTKL